MKKTILILAVLGGSYQMQAQNINPEVDNAPNAGSSLRNKIPADSLLSRWCIDLNLVGGLLNQNFTSGNPLAQYSNALTSVSKISDVQFKDGLSLGADLQVGYFFGKKRHFGAGLGVSYMYQQGNVTLDAYHVEYQATDIFNKTYRQLITANGPIKEAIKISNLNIPILFKYKTKLSERVGFTADAGLLVNLLAKNSYTTDASFDYEAIYKYSGVKGANGTVYETSPIPDPSDLIIKKVPYVGVTSNPNIEGYFNKLRADGYNVGLGVKPNANTGNVDYKVASIGFLVRPAVSFYLSEQMAINLGLYYIYQNFDNNNDGKLTDKLGSYGSVMNGVSSVVNHNYGISFGARYFIKTKKDTDGDGVTDDKDKCVTDPGPKALNGCPDTDGDGIADVDDACPTVAGLAKFNGCPDTDGDEIPDNEDACPARKGLAEFEGCPDTDGDGIPDNEDECPEVAGPSSNRGCPIVVKEAEPEPEPEVKVSKPLLFDVDRTSIKKSSLPVLKEAAKKLKENKKAKVEIHGYTDNTGTKQYNKVLSKKRAVVVKNYLERKGVDPKSVKTIGHGVKNPAASNATKEGRAKNRRVIIKMKDQ